MVSAKRGMFDVSGWKKWALVGVGLALTTLILMDASAWLYPPPTIPEQKPNLSLKYVRNFKEPGAPPLTEDVEERVRDEIRKNSMYCATLNAEQQRWCEYHIGTEMLTAYNNYRDGRVEHCEGHWHEETDFELKYYVLSEDQYYNYTPAPSAPNWDVTWGAMSSSIRGPFQAELGPEHGTPWLGFKWGTRDHGKTLSQCKFPGTPAERGHWYVNKVGPFTNRNKGSWHFIWFHAFAKWAQEFEMPGVFGRKMTASLVSFSDKGGNIVPFPPLHMHHFHLFQVDPLAPYWPHIVFTDGETHGDDMCAHEGLGALCYFKMYPPGFGRQAVPRYFVDSLANFVADPVPGVDDVEFYCETSILVTEDKRLNLEPVMPFLPMMPGMHGAMPALAGTYIVPKHVDSMTWFVYETPYSIEYLWWKWHTHYYYTNEIWIVVGDGHEIFGLDSEPYVLTQVPFTTDEWTDARRNPTGDPVTEFRGDIEQFAKFHFAVPQDWELPYTQRYLDLSQTQFGTMEHAQNDMLDRYREFNKRQLLTGGPPAEFLYRVGDIETFHSKVGGRMWTHRPLTKPSRNAIPRGTKLTVVAFHRNTPFLCGDTCEDSKQPVRQHVINVANAKVSDPVLKAILSPNGQYVLYNFKYHPVRCGFLAFLTLATLCYLIYLTCFSEKRHLLRVAPSYDKYDDKKRRPDDLYGDDLTHRGDRASRMPLMTNGHAPNGEEA